MSLVQPTRILLLGGGGREHALAWKLAAEPGVNDVYVAPGSDAIALEPRARILPDVDPLDPDAVVRAARANAVELVVAGPEAPLAAGVGDALATAGVAAFAPSAAAAEIETSKAFCREVASAAGVRMAEGAAFDAHDAALAFARRLDANRRQIVVKADGLAGGKGVTVCDDLAGAEEALHRLFSGSPDGRVVVEERLSGREASVIALCDGRDALALPAARDHKRLLDGDRGPNTGGMGAYSPLPDLPDEAVAGIVETVHRPILRELAERGRPFRGALYAGLMLTSDGPVLLECNARFGDPETQAVLPRVALALGPLLLAAARGQLLRATAPLGLAAPLIPATRDAAVAVVLAAEGYPERPRTGDRIEGLDLAAALGAQVFHSGTARSDDGWVTRGGRVLTVVGRGSDLGAARNLAGDAADAVTFPGRQRRGDVAAAVPHAGGAVAGGASR